MSGFLRQVLLGTKAAVEFATQKVEEAEAQHLENKVTGSVDAEKVRTLLEKQNAAIDLMRGAIDQLQQRVSNLEGTVNRLEARLPPAPPAHSPIGGAGGWIDPTTKR